LAWAAVIFPNGKFNIEPYSSFRNNPSSAKNPKSSLSPWPLPVVKICHGILISFSAKTG
jgi:hypothetical protein